MIDPTFIDLYCERTGPGFWDEPWNALTNMAFPVAALVAWWLAQRRGDGDWPERAVIAMGGLIGVGSFLFHTFATPWSEWADVVPIWGFVAAFILLTIYRLTGESPLRTLRIAAIAGGVTVGLFLLTGQDRITGPEAPADPFNGSLQYLPALVALVVFAGLALWRGHPARFLLGAATLTFLVSLGFRTVDLAACAVTGIGTHFLWHLLNGLMIGLLLSALVLHLPPRRGTPLSSGRAP